MKSIAAIAQCRASQEPEKNLCKAILLPGSQGRKRMLCHIPGVFYDVLSYREKCLL